MNMIKTSNKRNIESDIQFLYEKAVNINNPRLRNFLENGKKMISLYMDNKYQRLKEKEKELEIIRFEEEVKLFKLRQTLGLELEALMKKENIISLNEESGEENEELANFNVKKKNKKIKRQFNDSN